MPSPAAVVLGVGGLYVAQSVIGGVTFQGLPAVLRKDGASLNEIAFVLLTVLPWSFKFLWAPAIERIRLPAAGGNRSRPVVGVIGAIGVAALVAAALTGPSMLGAVTAALVVGAFASATVDIACDGYAVESLAEKHRGWGNAAQVGGAYLGSAIGGGAFLILIDQLGWRDATLIMAGVLAALGLPFLLSRNPLRPHRSDAERPSLKAAFRRREVWFGIALVGLYVLGQKWAMVLIQPYLVDAGMSLSLIGILNGFVGAGVGIVGALLGGWATKRHGTLPVMMASLLAQVAVTAALSVAAYATWKSDAGLGALAIASSGVMAAGFVALYAELMGRASLDQAGVDFTLFQCADGVVSLIGWQLVGVFGDALGFAWCFGIAAAIGLGVAALLPAVMRG
ncbi:MFS transporter [Chelatococcus sambhunathii]|uniref:MFS transporter n=1 Tax=Chelatococcus sambhunathii TaxID=363953 RepID=A0ABU1DC48_9HYPH|nr:MFS transporter [Chelatococcus sambhunathii]